MSYKTALITVASRGLGRDMALNLAKDDVHILLTYQANKTKVTHSKSVS